jgi:hypothetical protein
MPPAYAMLNAVAHARAGVGPSGSSRPDRLACARLAAAKRIVAIIVLVSCGLGIVQFRRVAAARGE